MANDEGRQMVQIRRSGEDWKDVCTVEELIMDALTVLKFVTPASGTLPEYSGPLFEKKGKPVN